MGATAAGLMAFSVFTFAAGNALQTLQKNILAPQTLKFASFEWLRSVRFSAEAKNFESMPFPLHRR